MASCLADRKAFLKAEQKGFYWAQRMAGERAAKKVDQKAAVLAVRRADHWAVS